MASVAMQKPSKQAAAKKEVPKRDDSAARACFFNSLTGAVVYGHGQALIGPKVRAAVALLADTLSSASFFISWVHYLHQRRWLRQRLRAWSRRRRRR